jgi:hypothetical protein
VRAATENRTLWSKLRNSLTSDEHNAACLAVVDEALFVVCLDDDERIVRQPFHAQDTLLPRC